MFTWNVLLLAEQGTVVPAGGAMTNTTDMPAGTDAAKTVPLPPRLSLLERIDAVRVFLAAFLAFYLLTVLLGGGSLSRGVLISLGANYPPYVARGEWWRLLTSMFLHAGVLHLVVNGFSFFVLGRFVSRSYGRSSLIVVFLAGGVVASLASFLARSGEIAPGQVVPPSLGASGGIAALFGLIVAFTLRYHKLLEERFRRAFAANIMFVILVNLLIGLLLPGIDNWAHLGGLLAGLGLGFILVPGLLLGQKEETAPVRGTAYGLLGVLALSLFLAGWYLLFAVALPRGAATSLYAEENNRFQVRYPAPFSVYSRHEHGTVFFYFTNHYNHEIRLLLMDAGDYRDERQRLLRLQATLRSYTVNQMQATSARWVQRAAQGSVSVYWVGLRGPEGTSGEGLYAVFFVVSSQARVPRDMSRMVDYLVEHFHFIYHDVI